MKEIHLNIDTQERKILFQIVIVSFKVSLYTYTFTKYLLRGRIKPGYTNTISIFTWDILQNNTTLVSLLLNTIAAITDSNNL